MEDGKIENREKEAHDRQVVLHFVRHGEAKYSTEDDYEGELTEKGREQARGAGRRLFKDLPSGVVIAIDASTRVRAQQTAQVIGEELIRLDEESDKGFIFHNLAPKVFNRVGMSDAATEEALDVGFSGRDPITVWLENPTANSQEMESDFRSFVKRLGAFAKRLNPQGPDVHIVVVTHTGPSELFVGSLLGENLQGRLDNCEEFKIVLPTTEVHPILTFKGVTSEVSI